MMDQQDYEYTLISAYLKGHLNDSDRRKIEQRIKEDQDFVDELNRQREAREAFQIFGSNGLNGKLASIRSEANISQDTPTKKLTSWYVFRIAAAILVLILIGIGTWVYQQNASFQTIAMEIYPDNYSQDYRAQTQSAGYTGNQAVEALIKGFDAYNSQDFELAGTEFSKASTLIPKEVIPKFYQAICLIQNDQLKAAQPLLEEVVNSDRTLEEMKEAASVRLGAIYFRQGMIHKAIPIYQKLNRD